MKFVRSTKHTFAELNAGKYTAIREFLDEYRVALQLCIDYLWTAQLSYKDKVTFDTSQDLLYLPKFLNYNAVDNTTKLSGRAFCSAFEQAIGIVRSQTRERSKLLWIKSKLLEVSKTTTSIEEKLANKPLIKPIVSEVIGAQLSSKCIDFSFGSKHFDLFIRLKSTGFDHIKIPIKFHKADKKFAKAKLLTGILLRNDGIDLRYEQEMEKKSEGQIVGADTGVKSMIVLSDGQTTPLTDDHHHSLTSIMQKLSRQTKNSKAFHRTQEQRKNFINWSVNRLNLTNIKQINLEQINTFNGQSKGRFLSHFSHSLIANKLSRLSEELGVLVNLKPSIYKSQRCSGCGIVCKKHRNGKGYHCSNCGLNIDSDLNGALNNQIDLPDIPKFLAAAKLNLTGFFWKPEGFFDLAGQALGVPDADKNGDI